MPQSLPATMTVPIDPALFSHLPNNSAATSDGPEEPLDSVWEYEYDESETEIFYVTVDLPSSNLPPSTRSDDRPSTTDTASTMSKSINPDLSTDGGSNTKWTADTPTTQNGYHHLSRVQFVDLHTSQPLLSYQNHIYNCNWASNVGTELLFTTSSQAISACFPTAQSISTNVVLAGKTAARLMGCPVSLAPRPTPLSRTAALAQSIPSDVSLDPTAVAIQEQPSPPIDAALGQQRPIRIPLGPAVQAPRAEQAAFLERMIATKRARGEEDEVTVYARRVYTGAGWRTQERVGREVDEEDKMEDVREPRDPTHGSEARASPAASPSNGTSWAIVNAPTRDYGHTLINAHARQRGSGSPRKQTRRGRVRRVGSERLFRDYAGLDSEVQYLPRGQRDSTALFEDAPNRASYNNTATE